MDANEYQKAALRTAEGKGRNIINCALGLTGEAGEFADAIKKELFQGHERDRDGLAKELGDIAWYLAVAADVLSFKLSDILSMNVEKLKKRYPNGFDEQRSVGREEYSQRQNNESPDVSVKKADMHKYGYHYDGMLPLTYEVAKQLYIQGKPIYKLYESDTEALVESLKDIDNHDGLFGIEKMDWQM